MAREQWKTAGIYIGGIGLVVTILGSLIGIAWGGSGKLTAFEKDIESNRSNTQISIDSVKELADIVSGLKKEHAKDYRELKNEVNESKLRDARIATQYAAILGHMSRQTASGNEMKVSISGLQVDMGKIQTKVDTLFKDNSNVKN